MLDKRRSYRRRTLLGGRIQVAKLNGWAVDCTVRDMNAAGVSLVLPPDTNIPDVFDLGISGRNAEPARLVWYRGGRAGVELTSRLVSNEADPDRGDSVRLAQWDGRCRRIFTPASGAVPIEDRFASRIAAISSRRTHEDRRRAT